MINNSLTASDNSQFQFVTDGEGNYGYLGADDSFIPFSKMQIIDGYFYVGTTYGVNLYTGFKNGTITFFDTSHVNDYFSVVVYGGGNGYYDPIFTITKKCKGIVIPVGNNTTRSFDYPTIKTYNAGDIIDMRSNENNGGMFLVIK